MSDPLFVKAILINANQEEKFAIFKNNKIDLGLSDLIIPSLATNQLSYLATANPNWTSHAGDNYYNPKEIDIDALTALNNALKNVQNVFNEIQGAQLHSDVFEAPPIEKKMNKFLKKSSNSQFLDFIRILFTDLKKSDAHETATILTAGLGGKATKLESMNQECLNPFKGLYQKYLTQYQQDHTKVIGLSTIGHAVDTKHMLAALYYLFSQPRTKTDSKDKQFSFNDFVSHVEAGFANPLMERLMRSRLQQMILHIWLNKAKINLSDSELKGLIKKSTKSKSFNLFKRANDDKPSKKSISLKIPDEASKPIENEKIPLERKDDRDQTKPIETITLIESEKVPLERKGDSDQTKPVETIKTDNREKSRTPKKLELASKNKDSPPKTRDTLQRDKSLLYSYEQQRSTVREQNQMKKGEPNAVINSTGQLEDSTLSMYVQTYQTKQLSNPEATHDTLHNETMETLRSVLKGTIITPEQEQWLKNRELNVSPTSIEISPRTISMKSKK